ncbi:MAG: hypothetical protein NXI13_07065 [Proteobacteria bacterium]|nr:hypothetical protein [Pseudomonadota bacterium]
MFAVRLLVALIFIILGLIAFILVSMGVLYVLGGQSAISSESGAKVGSFGSVFIYITAPAIIVACFRSQYKKRTRLWAGLKTILILTFIGLVWFRLSQLELFTENPSLTLSLHILVLSALVMASGLLSSRFLPLSGQPPLGPRPPAIVYFEYVMLATFILGVLSSVISLDEIKTTILQSPEFNPVVLTFFSLPVIVASAFIYAAFTALITVLISRHGSIMVRNAYLAFFIFGIIGMAVGFFIAPDVMATQALPKGFLPTLLYILLWLCSILGAALLVSKSARAWINREGIG